MFTTLSFFRRSLLTSGSLLLVGGAMLCAAPQAYADEYLVGALLFAADSNGATTSQFYQYDTNSTTGTTPLDFTFGSVTYGKDIALDLLPGSNTLTFVQQNPTPISAYNGTTGDLGLFFSSTNTPYNPSSGARTPDLLVSRATDGSTAFFFPNAATSINDYVFSALTTYGGATSFTLGADPIKVTSYGVDNNGSGTVTIQVGAASAVTPEPGSVALLVGMGITGMGFAARRKRRK